jgi:hypothetical protein
MSSQEVYLPDERVLPVQQKLYEKYPSFIDWNTDFLTVRVEDFEGQLPDGTSGKTPWPVIQFMIVSDYPASRPIQRAQGVRHATVATVWERAWEEGEKEFKNGHYVNSKAEDPLEVIFAGVAHKHVEEITSLSQIMN